GRRALRLRQRAIYGQSLIALSFRVGMLPSQPLRRSRMEAVLREFANNIALGAELTCVLIVAVGAVLTLTRVVVAVGRGKGTDQLTRRAIFVGFAGWIVLALEFALGADIVRSAIAPTWDDIG